MTRFVPDSAAARAARPRPSWLSTRSGWLGTRPGRPRGQGAGVGVVAAAAVGLLRTFRWRWRSSLQLRVVSTTLVVSAAAVSLLGFFLIQQFAENLLQHAEAAAYTQAADGLSFVQTKLPAPGESAQFMYTIVTDLKSSDENPGADYGIAVTPPPGSPAQPNFVAGAADGLPFQSFPVWLDRMIAQYRSRGMPVSTLISLQYSAAKSGKTPGVLYAAPFGGGYELYYFFPLTQLQNELGLAMRTMALVGLALVFLLAGIAWLVTRWVVVPVARAAQGAQLLSKGNLDERLVVRGNDEVAALATSFNEMAASLQDKMRELEDLSQVQRQFVSDVSHELRTPLTTIRMAADLLFEAREQLASSAARSAELLQSQLGRFESLLSDLLEISRYDANAATLDAEFVDVGDLVRDSAEVAQHLAERRGARVEFRLPAEPCMAELDRRRVERILRNLLVNAVEHGEGRDVVVTVADDRDAVAVAVRDYGVGLASGEEHMVFDRFWRADPARARTTGGTGLGLAIALEDARLHRGWLEAWGEPGRGSVFRLTLPREVGIELVGSPLPLGPDGTDLDGLLAPRHLELPAPDGRTGHAARIVSEDRA
ncbi:MAG TPA: MtrAB system histidine kinase MtrB [Streptosporangiaceae bacterium]|nr:MtrAB system histidine kinase MtrB [Streptosporangiaceae bacterium]